MSASVYFVETEPESEQFFETNLPNKQIAFLEDLTETPADAECLSIFITSRITAEFLEAHPSLRFIAARSSGIDHIDLDECNRRGVR